jgi:hypothetical protein
MNALEKRIAALPQDVKEYIYWEYLDTEVHYRKFTELLESNMTKRLNIELIRPYISIVLAKPKLVSYLRNMNRNPGYARFFDIVYFENKIKGRNKKRWKGVNNGDAFCVDLVMYMYH